MPKSRVVKFGDVEYPSLRAFARDKQIGYGTLRGRLKLGLSLEEAVAVPAGELICIEFDGVRYTSLKKVADAAGVSHVSLCRRVLNGETVEHAVAELRGKDEGIIYRGKHYKSINDLCKKFNKCAATVRNRLNSGMTLDEAMTRPARQSKAIPVVVDEVEFRSISAACKFYGTEVSAVRYRVASGVPFDVAVKGYKSAWGALRKNKCVRQWSLFCDDSYALIECAECGKHVMLPIAEAMTFVHSDKCKEYEWREG